MEENELPLQHHPFYNELILAKLVTFIQIRDIPNCRVVCKTWNRHFLPRMRTTVQVKCLDQTSFGRASTSLARFIAVMEQSAEIPFGNYSLLNLNMNDSLVEKFFEVCGRSIKTLRIQFLKNDIDIASFRQLILINAPVVENLSIEGLGLPDTVTNHPNLFPYWFGYNLYIKGRPTLPFIKSIEFKTDEGQKCHEGFLLDLFKATINLSSLTFIKYSKPFYSVRILGALQKSTNYLQIVYINLESLNEESLQILIMMSKDGMKLKHLMFQSLTADVESQSLEELILNQKDSLETVTFNEVLGSNHLRIRVPPLKKLKVLTRSAICPSQILFGPVCYGTLMQNLKELSIYAFADELNWDEYFSETVNWLPCGTLKKLKLPINMKDPLKLKRLAKIFPSVTKVVLSSPSDEIVPWLWELWPEMDELYLLLTDGNYNVDSLLTGIPTQECQTILSSKAYGEVDIERIRTGNSIAHLRGLKKLELEISPRDIFSSFYLENKSCLPTDISGYFGLAYLTNLEHLTISTSQISKECVTFLNAKYPSCNSISICDEDALPISASTLIVDGNITLETFFQRK